MKVALHPFTLTLAHSFGISRERHDQQETLIVSLSHQGETGYGEATANTYYEVRISDMITEIEGARALIENASPGDPQAFYTLLREAQLSSFACCALDMAAWDLYGKLEGKPLHEIWGTSMGKYPVTNYTIGLDTTEVMVAKMQEIPWPVYKIKLGTDRDVAIVTELRKHTDAIFRVDANCAWTARETIENALALAELGVEFIEQPLPAGDWEGMERVAHHCVLPVMADESCLTAADVSACALQMRRADPGASNDPRCPGTGTESYGGVYDRIHGGHLCHRTTPARTRLRGHGWCYAVEIGHRHGGTP